MKIKISLVSLLLAFAMSSFAQEARTVSDVAGVNTSFDAMKQHTWDNWFIQVGGGVQSFVGDGKGFGDLFTDVSVPAFNLSIGRWWAPYWGFRVKAQEGGYVGDFYNYFSDKGGSTMKFINVHLDAMWNVTQYFPNYNANRFFNFIPYAGVGAYFRDAIDNATTGPKQSMHGVTINAGLLFQFRLSNHVGLHLDLAGTLLPGDDYFNGIIGGRRFEGIADASVGLTFNLGKTYFEVVQPMDQGLINDLNNKINDLRNENDLLSRRPVKCDPCPQCPPAQQNLQPATNAGASVTGEWKNVVLFRIGSAVIDANQRINIYNTAQFVKSSGEKVKVVGYADKQTGSAAYNLRLSERRARAVAQELTSRFGIASNNIVVEWKGDTEQPFKENAWNRVVIMSAK